MRRGRCGRKAADGAARLAQALSRRADDSAECFEHAVGDAAGGQRSPLHLVVIAGDLGLARGIKSELGRETRDDLGSSELGTMTEPGKERRPGAARAAERTAEFLCDRAGRRRGEVRAIERPSGRSRKVTVDQRLEFETIRSLHSREVGKWIGRPAGSVLGDELA